MKKCSCIKLYGFTLALFLCISLFAVSPLAAEPVLADGATFEEIKNISIENTDLPPASSFYLYSPSKPHSFDLLSSFLNGVIIVYPDKPYASKAEALAELWDKGLIGIAESAPTYIVVAQPSNGISWSSEDLDLYWVYQYYLSGGYFDIMKGIGQNPMETQFVRHTMQTLQYVIAEGSGATFANNVLSQDAGRIAGLLSFGGDVQPGLKPGYAVPAYLVNTTDAAISYWKTANGTDTRDGNTFVNSGYTQKKVIVAEGSSQFDAAIIRDAWGSLLSRSTRLCVSENLVLKSGEKGDWMLMNWPNLDEIGLNLFSFEFDASTGKANPYGTLETKSLDSVHLYVPDAIKSNPSKAVPLVFVLHGMSDDPLNVVMGCGWADKAVEENFIIIAPATEDADYLIKLLEYAKSQYAIDETRVYCSGFSMGGMNTIQAGFAYPGIFAAAAPMGATGSLLEGADSSYDLPICSVVGSIDTSNVTIDDDGNSVISGIIPGALEQAFSFNEIDPGTADYFQNKYWGYKGDKFSVVKDKDVNWEISDFYKDGYAQPLIKLVTFVGAGHANGDYMATIAWDFFSGFSRSANGAVVETG
ncbi:MAG: hypothetical protein LBT59_25190, partial [Clostridiales bacterium]|nr:hypothetical protein [Clostridiales bacterium]